MTKITVELSDPVHEWLSAETGTFGLSLEQIVERCLEEQHNKLVLDWAETALLRVFQNVTPKCGWVVPAASLPGEWGNRGTAKELDAALRGLKEKNFVESSEDGYVLTEQGYDFRPRLSPG